MSTLLTAIIHERKNQALSYGDYLAKIASLTKKVNEGKKADVPKALSSPAKVALYNNLDNNVALAMACDEAVLYNKQDGFRGDLVKERNIKKALYSVLNDDNEVERIFQIVVNQKEY
jgi:type I restriction enzyme R subunit